MTLNETPPDPVAAIDQSYAALMQRLDDFQTHMDRRFDDLNQRFNDFEKSFNRGFWMIMCMMGVKLAVILAMLGVIISRLP